MLVCTGVGMPSLRPCGGAHQSGDAVPTPPPPRCARGWGRRPSARCRCARGAVPPAYAVCVHREGAQGCFGREEGGGGKIFVYQKWPKSILPFVNFVFPHYEMWVRGGGGGPPLLLRCTAVLVHHWGGGIPSLRPPPSLAAPEGCSGKAQRSHGHGHTPCPPPPRDTHTSARQSAGGSGSGRPGAPGAGPGVGLGAGYQARPEGRAERDPAHGPGGASGREQGRARGPSRPRAVHLTWHGRPICRVVRDATVHPPPQEANGRRQRQTIRYRGLVPTPPPPGGP